MSFRRTGTRTIGLARALSKLGYCSRSQAARLIAAGQVRVNGRIVRDREAPIELNSSSITVIGARVAAANRVYLALNKPRGVVTTAQDEKGRDTVYGFLPKAVPWVAPVGRLDKASEGLLLLTNDSEWAARITAPETHLEKIYHVQIAARGDQELLNRMRRGVRQPDGDLLTVKTAAIVRQGMKNSWLEVVLDEGKNRHIRRLFAGLEVEVMRLIRIAIGPMRLGDLKKGEVRNLTTAEKTALDQAMQQANSRGSARTGYSRVMG